MKRQYNALKKYRNDKGKTQTEVSRILGIEYKTYCRYENGINKIPHEVLIKLKLLYDVNIDDLLDIEGKYNPCNRLSFESIRQQFNKGHEGSVDSLKSLFIILIISLAFYILFATLGAIFNLDFFKM